MNQICEADAVPFRSGYRASGVVLDISALPSRYSIGDVGPAAVAWIDHLKEAGQGWWHAVVSDRSGSGDSAHAPHSSFAGNPLLISPDWLIVDGLLDPHDCRCVTFPEDSIDYDVVIPFKHWLLEKAWKRFNSGARSDLRPLYEQFRRKQGHWLEDYALFEGLKAKYRVTNYRELPVDLVRRRLHALVDARQELTGQTDLVRFSQFLLYRQTRRLKEYARFRGLRLIGDLPFSVDARSCDVWVSPELFVYDGRRRADIEGDLIPLWFKSSDALRMDNDRRRTLDRVSYRWCVDRLHALLTRVDVARVNSRAISPKGRRANDGARTTRGARQLYKRHGQSGGLGSYGIHPDLSGSLTSYDRSHLFEVRNVQFTFDGLSRKMNPAEEYAPNTVVYAAVHEDSGGLSRSVSSSSQPQICTSDSWELIRRAWSSMAGLTMISFPDLLNVKEGPEECGSRGGHRRWRCSESMLSASSFYLLRELTKASNRSVDKRKKSIRPLSRSLWGK